ncbi:TRAP transporter permease [Marinobacter salexigens]|uniref:TRAP transporter fused permease subunit n=1 Tax=Marinobacter salexigens TaxID=1925763 RepID=A0ABS6A903_9GAMM|nr:TRAP transporter fused permease subunit [Marinobacter salexigens]
MVGAVLAMLAIYVALFGTFDPAYHRPLFFAACVLVAVLVRPLAVVYNVRKRELVAICWMIDLVLLGVLLLGIQRFVASAANLQNMLVSYSLEDQLIALGALIALIEFTRREFGLGLSLFSALTLIYCFFGESLPGVFQHAGFTMGQTIEGMWYGFTGVFGMPVAVVIELLFIYIVFGVMLEATGAGPALIRMAIRATGRIAGGPAHSAILASMLFGTMSGSVTANVAGTGAFTIPMIKNRGFSPAFAGAVEAAASTGGQIIPPVMGAVAFLMAQLTGTSYLLICLAALLPAMLYVAGLFCAVYFEAKSLGIKPTPKDELPVLTRDDWLRSLMFIVPVITVIGVMATGRSPAMAGVLATISAMVFGFLNPEIRRAPQNLMYALAQGGVAGSKIMIAVGAIGIIIAGMNLTGLGLSFAQSVAAIGGDNLFLSLVLTALGCLVLGMGMPTLPAYLIIVLVMGPAIERFGVPTIAVHMFVLYFGVLSAITPPVALAAFAAAPIAHANPLMVSLVSIRLTLVGFIIPFLFVFNPSLLLGVGSDPVELFWGLLRIAAVIWALTTAFSGYGSRPLTMIDRGLRISAAILLMVKGTSIELIGLALVGLLFFGDKIFARRRRIASE